MMQNEEAVTRVHAHISYLILKIINEIMKDLYKQ